MPRSCVDHIALITGASRGIGQAIAQRFAAEGAQVAVIGRGANRSTNLAGSLDETVALVKAAGGADPLVITADIGDPAGNKRDVIDQVVAAFGSAPDIFVHSAAAPREFGGGQPSIPFAETPREWFSRTVELNVWALWDFAEQLVPGMRARGRGWILAISSAQAAPRPSPVVTAPTAMGGACIYGGTKAFIDRIVTGAAQELYADNIAFNSLAPTGPVWTPLSATVVQNPAGGWEPMETMVEAALALCSSDPQVLTSRVAYSLPLLAELQRPVYTLDGSQLYDGWQPDHADPRKHYVSYLRDH